MKRTLFISLVAVALGMPVMIDLDRAQGREASEGTLR